jgi:hypothetical protein
MQQHKRFASLHLEKQAIHLVSPGKPTFSIWQAAVLAYASAKCGVTFTSIEQTDKWLRTNARNPQRLTGKAVCGLLLVEPPRGVKIFPTASPPTAA